MTWFAVGASVIGMGTSIAGGMSAANDAEAAGEKRAGIIERTNAENQRRRNNELKQQLGLIESSVAASNLIMSGSSQRYKTSYESEYRKEMSWDDAKARMDARAERKGAGSVASTAMSQGIGSAVGFAGQAASAWPTGG